METHSCILAWESPWTEEPGGLQSTESQRIRNDWAHTHTHTHTHILSIYIYIYSSVHSSSFGNISWVYSGEASSATFIILSCHNNWFMYSTWFNHRIRINLGSRLERKVLSNILHLILGEYGWSYSQWRKCLFEEMDQSWEKNTQTSQR